MRPRTSAVWNYFTYVNNDRAYCNICSRTYSRKGRTTSSLKRHLYASHPKEYAQFLGQKDEHQLVGDNLDFSLTDTSQLPELMVREFTVEDLEQCADVPAMPTPIKTERTENDSDQGDSQDQHHSLNNHPTDHLKVNKTMLRKIYPQPNIRKKKVLIKKEQRILSKNRNMTEFEVTGLNVSNKLTKMNSLQAIYAESLINNILREGLLNRLNEYTNLCDNGCRQSNGVSSSNQAMPSLVQLDNNAQ